MAPDALANNVAKPATGSEEGLNPYVYSVNDD